MDNMEYDEKYMLRAIELAKKGAGAVNPNPLVGAVIVKNGRIIGEGYHARYGELHAERAAFSKLTESAEGAEMYVTLEPCCHFGKQPPCTHAIVEHKIKRVYVGSDDPNDKVAGKGIAYLRENGIEVVTSVMKKECDALNNVFFHYITHKTPYVVMKYAMTMDGKIACYTGNSKWITGDKAREHTQYSRNLYTGIMVGVGTVLADNPMLTCRLPGGRNPVRIVCDTNLRLPEDCNLANTLDAARTIIALGTDTFADDNNREKIDRLKKKGVEFLPVHEKAGHIDLNELMIKLGEIEIDGILLEGGGILNYSMISQGFVHEVHAYVAPKIFGGAVSPTPVSGAGVESPDMAYWFKLDNIEQIGEDVLMTYKKK
ncbi:MAG: bifunctional diaminohydroxyphosphoribosylaminopyrimidine deaminase/5-amino-6-(5-phosphoribosylamino)uracil reductase RibD [Wujia sp.]